jgi:hypothetical protein
MTSESSQLQHNKHGQKQHKSSSSKNKQKKQKKKGRTNHSNLEIPEEQQQSSPSGRSQAQDEDEFDTIRTLDHNPSLDLAHELASLDVGPIPKHEEAPHTLQQDISLPTRLSISMGVRRSSTAGDEKGDAATTPTSTSSSSSMPTRVSNNNRSVRIQEHDHEKEEEEDDRHDKDPMYDHDHDHKSESTQAKKDDTANNTTKADPDSDLETCPQMVTQPHVLDNKLPLPYSFAAFLADWKTSDWFHRILLCCRYLVKCIRYLLNFCERHTHSFVYLAVICNFFFQPSLLSVVFPITIFGYGKISHAIWAHSTCTAV